MLFQDYYQLRRGEKEWQCGRLEHAVDILQALRKRRPDLVEPLYPLARSLHESGQSPQALEILEEALARGRDPTAAVIHRMWISFDLGDEGLLEEDRVRIGPSSQLARALDALGRARQGKWADVSFAAEAIWNADVAGRLLTSLEKSFAATTEPMEDKFHHRLFVAPAPPATSHDPESPKQGDRSPTRRKGRLAALEGAFAARRFQEVLQLTGNGKLAREWDDPLATLYRVYAAYATKSARKAAKVAGDTARRPTLCRYAEFHFLSGLCLVRTDPGQATHALVRAARVNDLEVHEWTRGLVKHLDLPAGLLP